MNDFRVLMKSGVSGNEILVAQVKSILEARRVAYAQTKRRAELGKRRARGMYYLETEHSDCGRSWYRGEGFIVRVEPYLNEGESNERKT